MDNRLLGLIAAVLIYLAAFQTIGAVHGYLLDKRERSEKVETECGFAAGYTRGTADFAACAEYVARGGSVGPG